jgi:hypothetical protein
MAKKLAAFASLILLISCVRSGKVETGRLAAEDEIAVSRYEADYFVGNEALSRGNLLEAEEFYLKSLSGIPGRRFPSVRS